MIALIVLGLIVLILLFRKLFKLLVLLIFICLLYMGYKYFVRSNSKTAFIELYKEFNDPN